MNDKLLIVKGLGDFHTAPNGVLIVKDGRVVLDEIKTFNRSRKLNNAGVNLYRILRRGIWNTVAPFDWEDENYWPLLRRYVEILHQPWQGENPPPGADVLVEIFDGCSENWMYDQVNYDKARILIRSMFANLGHLPYVHFGVGNECNSPDARNWVRDCVYPEFKAAGHVPFSYGASYCQAGTPGPMEWQKYEAELVWGEAVALSIYRQVHGVCDENSPNLITAVKNWIEAMNPNLPEKIRVLLSVDGSFGGLSDCDWAEWQGNIQRRPSPAQIKASMQYWMDRAQSFLVASGQIMYGMEYIDKAPNNEDCWCKAIAAISEMHYWKFGVWPENYGKYPLNWVEPKPPEPEPVPEPEKPKWSWRGWWNNNWETVAASVIGIVVLIILAILFL